MLVMLVDPDGGRARRIAAVLTGHGCEVDYAAHGRTAQALLGAQPCDAVVIAARLADGPGVDLCRRLRERGVVHPILLLSGDRTLGPVLEGLNAGADDVFRAPLDVRELHAKLRAMWMRARQPRRWVMELADLRLDTRTRTVTTSCGALALARYPYHLLRVLMDAAPAVVPFRTIEQQLWPDNRDRAGARRTHAYALRKALRSHFCCVALRTHQGYGYSLYEMPSTRPGMPTRPGGAAIDAKRPVESAHYARPHRHVPALTGSD